MKVGDLVKSRCASLRDPEFDKVFLISHIEAVAWWLGFGVGWLTFVGVGGWKKAKDYEVISGNH